MSNIPMIVTGGAIGLGAIALERQFFSEAQELWGRSLENEFNNQGDAFRHAYVAARFSQYLGATTAVG